MLIPTPLVLSSLVLAAAGVDAAVAPGKRQAATAVESVPAVTDSLLLDVSTGAAAAATGLAGQLGLSGEALSSIIASLQSQPGALQSASAAIESFISAGGASAGIGSAVGSLTSEYSIAVPTDLASSASGILASVTGGSATPTVSAYSTAASVDAEASAAAESASASNSAVATPAPTSAGFVSVSGAKGASLLAVGAGLVAALVL